MSPKGGSKQGKGHGGHSKGFKENDYVWIKDDDLLYTPARVVKPFKKGQTTDVELIEKGIVIGLSAKDTEHIKKCDKKTLKEIPDLTKLRQLTEESILYSLRKRFNSNSIYTNIGPILVSVNPFKQLPIYTPDVIERYMRSGGMNNEPHIFAVADRAYKQMIEDTKNQCCIVTGESGAGKTEATKLILQYLTEKSSAGDPGAKIQNEKLQKKILEMNPLLEAFGNAKTGRNDNSSRFGKLTQLFFNKQKGVIAGVGIIDYLLEKSRIVQQAKGERNYHIFYQLCAAAATDARLSNKLDISYPERYYYLTQTLDASTIIVPSLNDGNDWKYTYNSMSVLDISEERREQILVTLAGIMHLGNIRFAAKNNSKDEKDPAIIVPNTENSLITAAKMFGLDQTQLRNGLLKTDITTSKDSVVREHTVQQAVNARDALAKAIYGSLFQYLIEQINTSLSLTNDAQTYLTINVLDIFGFEQFQINSFEQLCINYCNEKLQVHFIDNVFKYEQQIYQQEGIDVKKIDFVDTSEVLSILEDKADGVYAILDEQNKLANGSDELFLKKVLANPKKFTMLKPPNVNEVRVNKFMEMNFNIVHFAGEVSYHAVNFLEKNSDKLLTSLDKLVKTSSNNFINVLFHNQQGVSAEYAAKKNRETLGVKFKRQLEDLMGVLNSSEPQFVRTVKPNVEKMRDKFTSQMVLNQIRYAGLLGVCEIHKNGYPVQLEFAEFLNRFNLLAGNACRTAQDLGYKLQQMDIIKDKEWQIGRTKIFLRNQTNDDLEMLREDKLADYVVKIQAAVRKFIAVKKYRMYVQTVRSLQTAIANRDEKTLRLLVDNSARLPNYGKMMIVLSQAKQVLSELSEQTVVLNQLTTAIRNQDKAAIQSLLYSAQSLGISSSNPVIREAENVKKLLSGSAGGATGFLGLLRTKMKGTQGVDENDINQITAYIEGLEQQERETGQSFDQEITMAEKLLTEAENQMEAQEQIARALATKAEGDLRNALNLIQTMFINTSDARKVRDLMLIDGERVQSVAFSNRLSMSQMLSGNLKGFNPRLSAMVDYSARLSKLSYGKAADDAMDLFMKYRLQDFYQMRPSANLKWTGTVIDQSLTMLTDDLNKVALQISKAILQYTGDMRFQYPDLQARFVLVTGLELPVLADEIYLQIIKNLSGNTRVNSEDRSWLLLILATQQFPPSKEFEPYLFSFLLGLKDTPLLVGNYAKLCIVQVDRTIELGPSTVLPDLDLIARYSLRPPILLCLQQLLNEQTIDIPVYPEVDVDSVVQNACEFAGITDPDAYGLFVVGKKITLQNAFCERLYRFYERYDTSKLVHVEYFAATWAGKESELFSQLIKRYGPEPVGISSINFRRTADNGGKQDVTDDDLQHPTPWWLFPGDIFIAITLKGKQPEFSLKKKLIFPKDPATPELVEQLRQQISTGELAIKEYEDVTELTALALGLRNRSPASNTVDIMKMGMDYLLPQIWINAQQPQDTASYVFGLYTQMANMLPREMYDEFITVCKKAEGYGSWFYVVLYVTPHQQLRDNEVKYIGVCSEGVKLFDSTRTECLWTYKFQDIVSYQANTDYFTMDVKLFGKTTSLSFTTNLPWEIYSIVYDYLQYKKTGGMSGNFARTSFDRNSVMRTRAY